MPTASLSSGALWLEPAFPAWRNHMGWSVTTASGLTVWHCCHGTLGAAPLRTSQWLTLWETLICSRVPSPVPVPLRLQLSKKEQVQFMQRHPPTTFFPVALETVGPMSVSTLSTNRKAFDQVNDRQQTPVKRRSYSSACWSPSNASTRHAYSWHICNFGVRIVTIPDIISVV